MRRSSPSLSIFRRRIAECFAGSLVLGIPLLACTSAEAIRGAHPAQLGGLGLDLEVAAGTHVSLVTYEITGEGRETIQGTIPLGDTQRISIRIGSIPEGDDYTITLTAQTDDGQEICRGSSTFSIVRNQATEVGITLSCTLADRLGATDIDVRFNDCPRIDAITVTSLVAKVGDPIHMFITTSDTDPTDILSHAWWVEGLGISSATTASYTCEEPVGFKEIVVAVSDGQCEYRRSIVAQCLPDGPCGNGTLDPGEECDDGNRIHDDACPSDCILPVCGDGIVEGIESCEPPEIGLCGADCDSIPPDPDLSPIDCNAYMLHACDDDFDTDIMAACPPEDEECRALVRCGRANDCVDASFGSLACYCGDVPPNLCSAGGGGQSPNGACKDAIEASLGTTTPLSVISGFYDMDTGAGRANTLFACMAQYCASECL